MLKNSTERYGSLQILLHWLVVIMMIAVYVGMEFRGDFPKEIRPILVRILHYSLGISILFLVVVRIAVRMAGTAPHIRPEPPRWQEMMGNGMHLALYGFMIAMPLIAWLSYSLRGKPVWFFGLELPMLVAKDVAMSKQLRLMYWHRHLAEWGYWLFGLHVAAALFHHYVVKDNTLLRMLPGRDRTGS